MDRTSQILYETTKRTCIYLPATQVEALVKLFMGILSFEKSPLVVVAINCTHMTA